MPLELELVTALAPLSVPVVLAACPLVALVELADSVAVSVPGPVPVAALLLVPCSSPQAIKTAADSIQQTLTRKRVGQAWPVSSEGIMVGSGFAAASRQRRDRYDTAAQRNQREAKNHPGACN